MCGLLRRMLPPDQRPSFPNPIAPCGHSGYLRPGWTAAKWSTLPGLYPAPGWRTRWRLERRRWERRSSLRSEPLRLWPYRLRLRRYQRPAKSSEYARQPPRARVIDQQTESGAVSTRHTILRRNTFFPLVECCVQLAHQVGAGRSQIMALARVLSHIEEIEIPPILAELPRSGSYCPLLVWALDPPEELPLDGPRPTTQRRQKIDSVELVSRWDRNAGGCENRCCQIHRDRHLRRSPVSRHLRWPPQYQRDTNSALRQSAFSVAEWSVAGEPLAPIVARENDQRVPGETTPFERRENLAHALVRSLQHADIISACCVRTCDGALIQGRVSHRCRGPRCIMLGGGRQVGNIERPVDRVVGDLEEKRVIRMAIHEIHRSSCDLVGEVARNTNGRGVLE